MGLREFLEHQRGGAPEGGPRQKIAAWQTAVAALIVRFKDVLSKFEQLQLIDWNVLRDHAGIRYNADALTIAFGESVITLEPKQGGTRASVARWRQFNAERVDRRSSDTASPPARARQGDGRG